MSEAIIRAEGLAVGYGGVPLLEDLDFEVERGEVFTILGGSGCGKSTLLRNLVGLSTPLAGRLHVRGEEARDPAPGERPPFGVMFQSGALFGSMTLRQNVALPLEHWSNLNREAIDAVADARLRLVGLDGFENHLPAEISGGMKKRAAIARALALDSDLIFLDEPSAGLDPITSAELDELILTLSTGVGATVVVVTHELASIFTIASNCIVLDKEARGIIARGDPRALRDESEDEGVRRFFNRQSRSSGT